MSIYGTYIKESLILEQTENEFKNNSKEEIKKKHNIKDSDISFVKKWLNDHLKVNAIFKKCKSIGDIRKMMNTKEYKEALKNDNA